MYLQHLPSGAASDLTTDRWVYRLLSVTCVRLAWQTDVHANEVMIVVTRSSMPGASSRSHGTAFYLLNTTLVVITVPMEA